MRVHLPSFCHLILLMLAWLLVMVATLLWILVPVVSVPPDQVALDVRIVLGLVLLPPVIAAIGWYAARRLSLR